MEDEREKVRQGIRDKVKQFLDFDFIINLTLSSWIKYKIVKKEEPAAFLIPPVEGSLNRQKKSPAQLQINTEDEGMHKSYQLFLTNNF